MSAQRCGTCSNEREAIWKVFEKFIKSKVSNNKKKFFKTKKMPIVIRFPKIYIVWVKLPNACDIHFSSNGPSK